MINTLIRLGKQLSDKRGEWEDIIDHPNINKELEKNIKCYVGEIVFDLDLKIVYATVKTESEYEEIDCVKLKNIKIQGGNNKAIYCCTPSGKAEQIRKTFFGTTDGKGKLPSQGQLQELIIKDYPQFSYTVLFSLLSQIFLLKNKFESQFTVVKGKDAHENRVIEEKLLFSSINPDNLYKVILIYTSVISAKYGLKKATPIANVDGYDAFIRAKFFEKKVVENSIEKYQKLCYASGEMLDDVNEVEFNDRFSLNKMFVKGTKNYATGFNKDNIGFNYQVNSNNQLYLTRASKFLLDTHKIKIAGLDHCIIPQFLHYSTIDVKYVLSEINKKTDLLFQSAEYADSISVNKSKITEPYWVTFLAFETDGNFLKTTSQIGNFSNAYLDKILAVLGNVDRFFRTDLVDAVDWHSATNEYGKSWKFNLATVYAIIPIRNNYGNKNDALSLFKMIFESRQIDLNKIYKHFCELILCHRYSRYVSFKNIKKYDRQYFVLAIRDSVFRYFALVTFLKQLNLLKGKEENEVILMTENEEPVEQEDHVTLFFKQMDYNSNQKAMFYLGRFLNIMAYTQYDKNINLIDKVNFNGMDKPEILRLRNSLLEKARQFDNLDKVIFTDANFYKYFNFSSWNMNREESVFFLLSGFCFAMIKN